MRDHKIKVRASFVVAAMLLAAVGRQAHAVWVDTQLTPKNLTPHHLAFTIDTKDVGALKQFAVTVKPTAERKGRPISPVLTARLHIVNGDTNIAVVPVEEKREDGNVTYWFKIDPKFLEGSKFEFGEHASVEVKDARGNKTHRGMPGGAGYWFYLRDFAVQTKQ